MHHKRIPTLEVPILHWKAYHDIKRIRATIARARSPRLTPEDVRAARQTVPEAPMSDYTNLLLWYSLYAAALSINATPC